MKIGLWLREGGGGRGGQKGVRLKKNGKDTVHKSVR